MAPLPPNSTPVYFVDYSFKGQSHTMAFRWPSIAGIESVRAVAGAFISALRPAMDSSWTVLGARLRSAGGTVSVPTAPPTVTGTQGSSNLTGIDFPKFVSFVGRGLPDGRRARIFVYGLVLPLDNDYRYTDPLPTSLANALAVLNLAAEEGTIVSVGGGVVQWNTYVNTGFNSYYEQKQRG